MKKIIVIVGPTASGKTKQSIYLAKKINAEIINGDSVQVYRELNIGSAKIKEAEKENILHHLFDIRNAGEDYSAFDFQTDVRNLIDKIEVPMIVGGTGFYIKSALYNYEFSKEEDYDIKDYDHLTNQELYNEIIKHDAKIDVDKNNRHRLVRALYLALNQENRSAKTGKDEPLYDILTFYLDVDRKVLKEMLVKRLDIMINDGLIEEVESLYNNDIILNIIGYREIALYLKGEVSLDEAKSLIIKSSMKLAKRQKTWFLNQMNSIVIDAYDNNASEIILKKTKEFLSK